jgi:hypothetical protein
MANDALIQTHPDEKQTTIKKVGHTHVEADTPLQLLCPGRPRHAWIQIGAQLAHSSAWPRPYMMERPRTPVAEQTNDE